MARFIGVLEQSNTSLGRQTSCLCLPNSTIHCLGRQREFIRQLSHTCFLNLQSPLCFIVITMCFVASGGLFVPLFKSYNSCFVIFCCYLLAVEVSVAHRSIVQHTVDSTKMRHDTRPMRQLEQTGPRSLKGRTVLKAAMGGFRLRVQKGDRSPSPSMSFLAVSSSLLYKVSWGLLATTN